MSRGGQRKGAGRKSSWTSGVKFEETVLIRVPKKIKDELLAIAHKLDSMETSNLVTEAEQQEKKESVSQEELLDFEQENNTVEKQTTVLNYSTVESNTPLQLDLLTDLKF